MSYHHTYSDGADQLVSCCCSDCWQPSDWVSLLHPLHAGWSCPLHTFRVSWIRLQVHGQSDDILTVDAADCTSLWHLWLWLNNWNFLESWYSYFLSRGTINIFYILTAVFSLWFRFIFLRVDTSSMQIDQINNTF